MTASDLQKTLDDAWEARDSVSPETTGAVRDAIEAALDGLDSGTFRVAEKSGEKSGDSWQVNQWLKKAVLRGEGLRDFFFWYVVRSSLSDCTLKFLYQLLGSDRRGWSLNPMVFS